MGTSLHVTKDSVSQVLESGLLHTSKVGSVQYTVSNGANHTNRSQYSTARSDIRSRSVQPPAILGQVLESGLYIHRRSGQHTVSNGASHESESISYSAGQTHKVQPHPRCNTETRDKAQSYPRNLVSSAFFCSCGTIRCRSHSSS
jgi:hypothetical protein